MGGSTINNFGMRGSDLDLCLALRCGVGMLYDEKCIFFSANFF